MRLPSLLLPWRAQRDIVGARVMSWKKENQENANAVAEEKAEIPNGSLCGSV